jgi:hypothetical protein
VEITNLITLWSIFGGAFYKTMGKILEQAWAKLAH